MFNKVQLKRNSKVNTALILHKKALKPREGLLTRLRLKQVKQKHFIHA